MRKINKIIATAVAAVSISVIPAFSALAASGIVNTDVLNVRTGPGVGYDVAYQLGKGTNVEVLESANGWSKINYGAGVNYVDSRFIYLPAATDTVMFSNFLYGKVNANSLNIRSAADVSSSVVGKAANGAAIAIIGKQNGFVIVKHNGQNAYMAENYITYITRAEYDAYYAGVAAAAAQAQAQAQAQAAAQAAAQVQKESQIVDTAMKYIGVPYVYGGSSPSGFDCSGFTSYVYAQFGYKLNRTAAGQASNGSVVASKADLKPGDLLLFKSSNSSGIGHVGMYIGGGNFVHASTPSTGVRVNSLDESYYKTRFLCGRRII